MECKGRIFRAAHNHFVNKRGEIVEQVRMRPVKRMSCSGCCDCDWLLREAFDSGQWDESGLNMDNLVNGRLYRLEVTGHDPRYYHMIIGFIEALKEDE